MPIQASTSSRVPRFLLALLVSTAIAAADVDHRRIGHDHYFNLEYDQAVSAYRRLLTEQPNDPTVFNHIASAVLFKELLRLGLLESSAFKGDNQFLNRGMHFTPDYPTSCGWPVRLPRRCWTISE